MGGDLKILAISNSEGCVERIVEAFENTDANIVAKEEKEGDEELFGRVSEAMNRGNYDYAIVAVDDHIAASITLNKLQNISAAVCDSRNEVRLARSHGANVIIVKVDQKKFDYLAVGIEKQKRKPEKMEQQREVPEKKEAREEKAGEEEEPEEDYAPRSSGKGLMGKIKDSLGIVDEK